MAHPVRLTADAAAQTLTIAWADGHTSVFGFEGLRAACPCATCRGGHAAMAEPVDPDLLLLPLVSRRAIKKLEPAGHYALQITWDDGHRSGLYRWDWLRAHG